VTQVDEIFSLAQWQYERIRPCELFYWKVDKYLMKNKARPFLKVKLIEPAYVLAFELKRAKEKPQQSLQLLEQAVSETERLNKRANSKRNSGTRLSNLTNFFANIKAMIPKRRTSLQLFHLIQSIGASRRCSITIRRSTRSSGRSASGSRR